MGQERKRLASAVLMGGVLAVAAPFVLTSPRSDASPPCAKVSLSTPTSTSQNLVDPNCGSSGGRMCQGQTLNGARAEVCVPTTA